MEPKFRLETEMGYGEYRRFSRTILLCVNHIALVALFMMAVLAVLSYLTWDAFYLILAVLVPAIFWLVIEDEEGLCLQQGHAGHEIRVSVL